ncbi:MAG TPA: BatD family protein [Candidatus Methylacidiphilales bacterium]|jgi:hypothetical protein|nr:BatD family protein [Candidatus Methylacidiphilales bacterium]
MRAFLPGIAALLVSAAHAFAATITVQVDPPVLNAGDTATLSVAVENGTIDRVALPQVDGLQVMPGVTSTTYAFTSGALVTTTARKYQLVASQPGDYTIPAFDVTLRDGTTLRSREVKLHVNAGPAPAEVTATPQPRAGPVVMPPPGPSADAPPSDSTPAPPPIPRDADGGPAKVFMLVTPQSTDAYVGEMVPVRIDFYIRQEANADQDSLPTLKGSDFMMNDFTVRGHASVTVLENEAYEIDTFLSAFSAPKSGDFPLAAERDTYWVKSITQSNLDPFGFTRNTNLAHGIITSNGYTMHIHPLPDAGRPAQFSGAVGEFEVASDAQPAVVAVGQPVTLTFGVRGTGNFDYVRCPVLPDDPHWKFYAPKSSMSYADEERTQGAKTFELSALPQWNGNVKLPRATFSYFNPRLKQYVTVPVDLPSIAVTGALPQPAPATTATETAAAAAPSPPVDAFAPNRAELGDLEASMAPVYRAPWFWAVQAALVSLPVLGLLVFGLRRWARAGQESPERAAQRRTLQQEERTMTEAVRRDDARAFFLAARHAVQLQLGARWEVAPEAITLGEIRRRDAVLAESVAALFAQADEVLYSGRAAGKLDLAHWQRVARECLHLQPA